MMKIVIAIDSFKGSLSSLKAGEAAKEGIVRVFPNARIAVRPLADGGEGTVEALTAGMDGELRTIRVTGPMGGTVECQYGILKESGTAILEMSGAAGLPLIEPERRNPMFATTYGVGEIIRDAMGQGCRRFIAGIGGSATNDGGVGMLQALGYRMLDQYGMDVPFGAQGLGKLASIDESRVIPELKDCTFRIACDVSNPLWGERGSSIVFGPQKGADPEMTEKMDQWMKQYGELVQTVSSKANPSHPGAGAAGGLGFAFLAFMNASLESGVKIVLEETGLENYIKEADMVVTGEGQLDGQTVMGKAPMGAARLAKKYGVPVIAFSGSATPDAAACNEKGIDAFFPILRSVVSLEEALKEETAFENLANTAEQVFRLIQLTERWK